MQGRLGHGSTGSGRADSIEGESPKCLKDSCGSAFSRTTSCSTGSHSPKVTMMVKSAGAIRHTEVTRIVRDPSTITLTRAVLETTGQSVQKDVLPFDLDVSAAIERGDVVIL